MMADSLLVQGVFDEIAKIAAGDARGDDVFAEYVDGTRDVQAFSAGRGGAFLHAVDGAHAGVFNDVAAVDGQIEREAGNHGFTSMIRPLTEAGFL